MGLFDSFRKKEKKVAAVPDNEIVAMADGELIDIEKVSDPVFAQKMMGESIAFRLDGKSAVICAPANGVLTAFFPTGHAFGITMENGVEILVHIGIDTVNAKGDGFKLGSRKQGDKVKAGEPIVTADLKKLGANYDMSTMLIITNANGKTVHLENSLKPVKRGDVVGTIE